MDQAASPQWRGWSGSSHYSWLTAIVHCG